MGSSVLYCSWMLFLVIPGGRRVLVAVRVFSWSFLIELRMETEASGPLRMLS